jgi:serine/threonine protein kinase
MSESNLALPTGTELEHYRIDSTLSAGGFGIVYLATDLQKQMQIVIKEYMPNKLAQRLDDGFVMPQGEQQQELHNEGMRLFLQEAAALIKLKHPNIVRVLNFFRANGTVYMVMEYRPGKNLQSYIKSRAGNLSENFLRTIFPPLLEGLRVVHETGFLHLDIKPGNIHLCPGGIPLLLDFGAVHPRNTSRKLQVTQVVTPGFSPMEQYNLGGYVGPWTDIYAIGATMRACIEGAAPVSAKDRHEKESLRPAAVVFKRRYSASLLQALDWAMEMDPLLRPQSVDEFLDAVNHQDDDSDNLLGKIVNTLTRPL